MNLVDIDIDDIIFSLTAGWGGERGRVVLGVKQSMSLSSSGCSLATMMVSFAFLGPVDSGGAIVSSVRSGGWFLASRALVGLGPSGADNLNLVRMLQLRKSTTNKSRLVAEKCSANSPREFRPIEILNKS